MKPTTLGQIGQLLLMISNLFVTMLTEKSKKISAIDGDKIQEAIDMPDKENFLDEFIKWMNNGCKLTYNLINGFVVEQIFRHRAEKGDRRLYLSDNTQNWIVKPYLKRTVVIRTDLGKLSEFRLPHNMNDSTIQSEAGKPGLMDIDTFFLLWFMLIFNPELGKQVLGYELSKEKWYLCHVELPNGKRVAVRVYWDDDEWYFSAREFDDGYDWNEGGILLFFATVKK